MAFYPPMQGMTNPAGRQFDRVMPNPIPVGGAPNTQFPIQTALPPLPATAGQMPMTPNPRLGVANAIANQFGGNPGAFQSAMGDYRNALQDWRTARPDYTQGMDRGAYRTAIGDWRQQRPDHPDFRSFWNMGQPNG